MTCDLIGEPNPSTLQDIAAFRLFLKCVLYTERQEALDTLRSIRSDRVRVEYSGALRELILHPRAEPAASTKITHADQMAEIGRLTALTADDGPVSHRDGLEVQVQLVIKNRVALDSYDRVTAWPERPTPTQTLDELRAESRPG
jgi:hypothetical protein